MPTLAILGASSQLAKDLIQRLAAQAQQHLLLYVRDLPAMQAWLDAAAIHQGFTLLPLGSYGALPHEALINFIGVGDPARAQELGGAIFDLTLDYDNLVLAHLKNAPGRRYLFLSSGAAYGSGFERPAQADTPACIPLNQLGPAHFYGAAKLHAECRHRALPQLPIVDLRVFNYFSRNQDLGARFLITDLLRAIQTGTEFVTSHSPLVRDYLHPDDFFQLVCCVLNAPPCNTALDCYSRAPVDKPTLLAALAQQLGLRYRFSDAPANSINATGHKPYYYSEHHAAAALGYRPRYSALEGVLLEATAALQSSVQAGE